MIHGHVHGTLDNFNEQSNELRVDVGLDARLAKENDGLIELEALYNFFIEKKKKLGVEKFGDYSEKLMEIQGYRM